MTELVPSGRITNSSEVSNMTENNYIFQDLNNMCRLCSSTTSLVSIFDGRLELKENMREVVEVTTGVKILPTDEVSHMLCSKCSHLTIKMFKFRNTSMLNDLELKEKAFIKKNIHQSVKDLLKQDPKLIIPSSIYGCDIFPVVSMQKNVFDYSKQSRNKSLKRKESCDQQQMIQTKDDQLVENISKKFKSLEELESASTSVTISQTPEVLIGESFSSDNERGFHPGWSNSMDEKELDQKETLLFTIKPLTKALFICEVCNKLHYNTKDLKKHISKHMRCSLCRTSFSSMEETRKHEESCTIMKITNNQPKLIIKRCDEIKDIREKYSSAFQKLIIEISDDENESDNNTQTGSNNKNNNEPNSATSKDIQQTNKLSNFERSKIGLHSEILKSILLEESEKISSPEKSSGISKPENIEGNDSAKSSTISNANVKNKKLIVNFRRKSMNKKSGSNTSNCERHNEKYIFEVSFPEISKTNGESEASKEKSDLERSEKSNVNKCKDKEPDTSEKILGISGKLINRKNSYVDKSKEIENPEISGENCNTNNSKTVGNVEESENFAVSNEGTSDSINVSQISEEKCDSENLNHEKTEEGPKTTKEKTVSENSKTFSNLQESEKLINGKESTADESKETQVLKRTEQKSDVENIEVISLLDNLESDPIKDHEDSHGTNKSENSELKSNHEGSAKMSSPDKSKNVSHVEKDTSKSEETNTPNYKELANIERKELSINEKSNAISHNERSDKVVDIDKTIESPRHENSGKNIKRNELKKKEPHKVENNHLKSKKRKMNANSKDSKRLKLDSVAKTDLSAGPSLDNNEKINFTMENKNELSPIQYSFKPNITFNEKDIMEIDDADSEYTHLENLLKRIQKSKDQVKKTVQTMLPSNNEILNLNNGEFLFELKNLKNYVDFCQIPVNISCAKIQSIKYNYETSSLMRTQKNGKKVNKNSISSEGYKIKTLKIRKKLTSKDVESNSSQVSTESSTAGGINQSKSVTTLLDTTMATTVNNKKEMNEQHKKPMIISNPDKLTACTVDKSNQQVVSSNNTNSNLTNEHADNAHKNSINLSKPAKSNITTIEYKKDKRNEVGQTSLPFVSANTSRTIDHEKKSQNKSMNSLNPAKSTAFTVDNKKNEVGQTSSVSVINTNTGRTNDHEKNPQNKSMIHSNSSKSSVLPIDNSKNQNNQHIGETDMNESINTGRSNVHEKTPYNKSLNISNLSKSSASSIDNRKDKNNQSNIFMYINNMNTSRTNEREKNIHNQPVNLLNPTIKQSNNPIHTETTANNKESSNQGLDQLNLKSLLATSTSNFVPANNGNLGTIIAPQMLTLGNPIVSNNASIPFVSYSVSNLSLNSNMNNRPQLYLVKNSNSNKIATTPMTMITSTPILSNNARAISTTNVLTYAGNYSSVSHPNLSFTPQVSSTLKLPPPMRQVKFKTQTRTPSVQTSVALEKLPATSIQGTTSVPPNERTFIMPSSINTTQKCAPQQVFVAPRTPPSNPVSTGAPRIRIVPRAVVPNSVFTGTSTTKDNQNVQGDNAVHSKPGTSQYLRVKNLADLR